MKSNKYQTIQKLITYWEEFEENNSNVTIQDFGQWLVQNSDKETSDNDISSFRDIDLDLDVYKRQEFKFLFMTWMIKQNISHPN